jgi:hypothetical protein|tara:strand:- start:124 stop:393 length:270 start_codon:yes stop_codon:yes gene_type:complete
MSDTKTFTFDDTVISTIAKTLQLAILTGTDVVDNLRQIEVQQNDNGTLSITPNYNSKFEHWVASLLEELESRQDVVETEKSEEATGLFE